MTRPRRVDPKLGPGAEFDVIRRFLAEAPDLPAEVRIGPGDDAAVLEGGWVLSTDLSVEDVHFRRSWLSDEEIGYRAAAAALSDLAAMAATPVGLLLSLAAPRDGSVDVVAIDRGARRLATEFGAAIIGGDLSRSPGPLVVDVVVVGRAEWPIRRDGAEPMDEVWVTGSLGASASAVRLWESGGEPGPALREAFAVPVPRVEEACCLVEHGVVDALIDISDGLVGDLGHLAAGAGVRIDLDTTLVPLAPAALEAGGREAALEAALYGGEDYELCFVTDPGAVDVEYFSSRHGIRVTRVGTVTEGRGVWLHAPGTAPIEAPRGGFDHWTGSPETNGLP